MKKTIFITFLLLILSANRIFACSCIKSNIKKEFDQSDLIFTGKVVAINERILIDSILVENGKFHIREYRQIDFKFKVEKLIKGQIKTEFIIISTTGGGTDCGNYFDLNSEHLVYSYASDIRLGSFDENAKTKPYFTTSLCTRTKKLERTKKREVRKLKRLAK